MPHGIPTDLIIFAVSLAGFLVIGLPMIMGRISLPVRVEFETIADHDLSPQQSGYFAHLDAVLRELNFRPEGNRKPVNMQGQALIRFYTSPIDPAIVMMNLLTSDPSLGVEHSTNYLEIVTRYRDGTILSTRNAEISDVLDPLPEHILIEKCGLRDPARLKKVHDEKSVELLPRDPIHNRPDEFEVTFNDFHDRWCTHQLERGLLRPSPQEPGRLKPTAKTALRGIFNYLNPLADNFTLPRFLLVLLLGMTIPGAAILWLTGPGTDLVAQASAATGLGPELVLALGFGAAFALSAAIVGFVFVGKSFIWSFLLTYILLRLVSDLGFGTTLILCMWSGLVADLVARWRLRRIKLA